MGAHHLIDAETTSLTRVAGRGALVASTALALTGAGAGLALAHGNDSGHGSGEGHTSSHDSGRESAASCDPDAVQGLLGDLGLSSSPDDLCAAATQDDAHDSSDDTATPASTTPASTAPAAATPTDPDDRPLAPGETRTIDLPDTPSGTGA